MYRHTQRRQRCEGGTERSLKNIGSEGWSDIVTCEGMWPSSKPE